MNKGLLEDLKLAILANGGETFIEDNCKCDPSVGMSPCEYCAIFSALKKAEKYISDDAQWKFCKRKETKLCDIGNQYYLGQSISGWISDCKMAERNIDKAYKTLKKYGLSISGYSNLSDAIEDLLKMKILDMSEFDPRDGFESHGDA